MLFNDSQIDKYNIVFKWYIARIKRILININKPIHVIFCLVDHYEPGTKNASRFVEESRVDELMVKYPLLAKKHKDSYGNIPRRTWFFPPHYHRYYNLKKLVSLCENGYGEIELHLHHGKTKADTSINLRKTLIQCVKDYSVFGVFGELQGIKKYGFIHGDWALDNSRSGRFCGVNDELTVLDETGCYADFTCPTTSEFTPRKINSIYYALDDPLRPCSHDTGRPVKKNGSKEGNLMIIQGPVFPRFGRRHLWISGDNVGSGSRDISNRLSQWLDSWIHVQGKKDWIFIKTHTHGASDSELDLGQEMDDIFRYFESEYSDGNKYRLHYVTAREMYNMVKAIENGEPCHNPEDYRDYEITKPRYDASPDICEASEELKNLVSKTYHG